MNFSEYSRKCIWPLSQNLADAWTVDDAMKGVAIMGGTGSGKTTASGKSLAMKFLNDGWGGLVLCAKTDEADQWDRYCAAANRSNDVIRFSKGSRHTAGHYAGKEIVFNPIDYEMKRMGSGAGETQNITNIFMNIYRMGNRIASEGDTHEERFWDTALKRSLNRIIDLIKLAKEDLSYKNMVRILSTSEGVNLTKVAEATQRALQGGLVVQDQEEQYCTFCLAQAYLNVKDEPGSSERNIAYDLVLDYFTYAFQSMGKRTKAIVIESFMGLAEPFLSGFLYRHFAGATNIFPEQTYTEQKVIVLDFSIKEFLDTGIIGQCVFKLMFQQAIERRNVNEYPTPVFIWCDEAQYFLNPYDQIFLTTARSSRTSTVYLSQNISNYLAVMGSGGDAKARVDSLMGNLSTKIFHANSDAETNEYASRLIGNAITNLANAGSQQSILGLNYSFSEGVSSQYLPQVQPKDFTILKTGGYLNEYQVQAILVESGREWSDKRNFSKICFTQKFENNE